jgi:hypothetical protein
MKCSEHLFSERMKISTMGATKKLNYSKYD